MKHNFAVLALGVLTMMNLSLTTLASEKGGVSATDQHSPRPVMESGESEGHQQGNEAVSKLNLLLLPQPIFWEIGQSLPLEDLPHLAVASKSCLNKVASGLNLELSLNGKKLTERDFKSHFGDQGFYKEARCLNLSESSFNPTWIKYLPKTLKSLKVSSIKREDFNEYGFEDDSKMLFELAKSIGENLENLEFLDISHNHIGDTGIGEIAKLPSLRSLNIVNNRISSLGATHVAKLTSLHTLDISLNQLGSSGADTIANMASLRHLKIKGNNLEASGAEHIARLSLRELDISFNNIRAAGAGKIATMSSLNFLCVAHNFLGDEGAAEIANMTSLHSLNIMSNHLTFVGVSYLARMTSLRRLNTIVNDFDDRVVEELSNMTFLNSLNILKAGLSDEAIRQLTQRLESCQITWNNVKSTSGYN